MFLFCCLLAATVASNFAVSGFSQITVGGISLIPHNGTGSTAVWHRSPPTACPHSTLRVKNMGETPVRASLYWKDSWPLQQADIFCDGPCDKSKSNGSFNRSNVNVWWSLPGAVLLQPGQSAVLRTPANAIFYYTRLVVHAKDGKAGQNATIWVEDAKKLGQLDRDDGPFSELDSTTIFAKTFEWGLSKIPKYFTKTSLQALIELVFPEDKPSVWDEVTDRIRYLIDSDVFNARYSNLDGQMRRLKHRLEQLACEIFEGQSDVHVHYMSIARELIGLEEEFIFGDHYNAKKYNRDMLPLYSNIIQLKAGFYGLGLKCSNEFRLRRQNVANVARYFGDMLYHPRTGANAHLYQIFREEAKLIHENEFDRLAYVRNELQNDGYLAIWTNLLNNPGMRLLDNRISYSYLAGNSSAAIEQQITDVPLKEPLTPRLVNGSYNELSQLVIYHKPCTCGDCLGGVSLVFKNNETSYQFGEQSYVRSIISLDRTRRIKTIQVNFAGSPSDAKEYGISHLEVGLTSDPNVLFSFGCTPLPPNVETFSAQPGQYIASMFASGVASSVLPLQNMAVSYLLESSEVDEIMDLKNWQDWTCKNTTSVVGC